MQLLAEGVGDVSTEENETEEKSIFNIEFGIYFLILIAFFFFFDYYRVQKLLHNSNAQ